VINRWFLKPRFHQIGLLQNYWNDFFLIPCALPPLLYMHRWMGWRRSGKWPTLTEILGHCALWSMLFEVFGPCLVSHTVADPWDVVAYFSGASVAAIYWGDAAGMAML